MRYAWKLTLVLLALLTTACSTQIGYKFADTLVEWEINEYVELDNQQQQQVDRAITELHHWHATSELPFYAHHLQNLRDKIATRELTEADLTAMYEVVFIAWQRALTALEPHALELLPQLTDAQVQQILTRMDEDRAEDLEKASEYSGEARVQRMRERAEENARKWIRKLTPLQERILREWVAERQDTRELWREYDDKWRMEFERALQVRNDPEQFPAMFKQLMFEPQQRSEERR